jgi:hypothetical protein
MLLASASSTGNATEPPKAGTSLFNGKDLSGWDTYLGPKYDAAKKEFAGPHIGLNQDPHKVFTVEQVDGAPAIHISGEYWGGISTKEAYDNYHLRLEFKWGEKRYAPRAEAKRDSGLLYHATGPHAAEWFFWMKSQEMQIQEGDCGDYWGLGGALVEVTAAKAADAGAAERHAYVYTPGAPLLTFQRNLERGGHVKKANNDQTEKPRGQWNTLELFTVGSTSVHVVNGAVKMVLRNSSHIVDNRIEPLIKGKLQIQSEGAEVFYRNIRIQPIVEIPKALLPKSPPS